MIIAWDPGTRRAGWCLAWRRGPQAGEYHSSGCLCVASSEHLWEEATRVLILAPAAIRIAVIEGQYVHRRAALDVARSAGMLESVSRSVARMRAGLEARVTVVSYQPREWKGGADDDAVTALVGRTMPYQDERDAVHLMRRYLGGHLGRGRVA